MIAGAIVFGLALAAIGTVVINCIAALTDPEPQPFVGSDLYEDRNGQRYTTTCFASDGDPRQGARILNRHLVERLREDGLLPLAEVPIDPTFAAKLAAHTEQAQRRLRVVPKQRRSSEFYDVETEGL